MAKELGAFLTIGELSSELGVPQHILRYWETRFPQLRPLQRAGNRRYYRPADVELARRINELLNKQGYTVRGAQLALSGKAVVQTEVEAAEKEYLSETLALSAGTAGMATDAVVEKLTRIRAMLAATL